MDDPLQHARELAAPLLAELARLRRDAPDDAALVAAEQHAQALAAVLGATLAGPIRPPDPNAADPSAGPDVAPSGVFVPVHPHGRPEEPNDS